MVSSKTDENKDEQEKAAFNECSLQTPNHRTEPVKAPDNSRGGHKQEQDVEIVKPRKTRKFKKNTKGCYKFKH
jgi:hypothetical protein